MTASSHLVCYCSGIGIVNAIEVVNAFPEEDGLQKFRQWVESPDPTIFGRFETKSGSNTRKKGSKVENVSGTNCNIEETVMDQNVLDAQEHGSSDDSLEIKQIFMNKHVIIFVLINIWTVLAFDVS